MKIMSNEKQLIRWERHYSDGSVEYTDEESTNNFEDNLSSVGGLIASRSYIQMKPVEWHERNYTEEVEKLKAQIQDKYDLR